MGLVAKHGHKPAVAFVEFETGGKGGVRAVETELKKTAGAAGIFISLAALSFLSAAAAYSARRRMPAVAKAGDAAFALGFALLSGALATFIRNATSEAPAAATEADVKALVDATAEGLGLAGAASRVNVQAPLYFSMRAGPYDFALLAFLWLACAFQLLLVFKSQDLVKGLPDSASLDETAYRITLLAFPMLTLIIVTGAVWAHFAWGRYWGWDPKETWSLITWFVYAFYMHARITHGWTGRPSAVISVAGFAVVVFTYLGVNLGLTGSGLHVYGKG
jgi:cytochrome c-type biogenesis protein CcsB